MKSFLKGAPALPPPPFTWLITIDGDAAALCPNGMSAVTIEAKTRSARNLRRIIPTPHPASERASGTVPEMTSIWLDEIAPDGYPSLDEDTTADVAIVGAGVAGVATAYHVSRGGAKVVVVEARTVAEAASGRNAGFLLAGVAENFVAAARRYGEGRPLRLRRVPRHNPKLRRALVGPGRPAGGLAPERSSPTRSGAEGRGGGR